MEKTLYATYDGPGTANDAFVELLQRGVSYMDVVLISKRTYRDPAFDADDGRLDVPESVVLASDENAPVIPPEEDIPMRKDPFGEIPGGMWLLDNMRYAGDLTTCLKELGFSRDLARDMETSVLQGGAILILRVPSGPVDDIQGWQAMERHGGTILTPRYNGPYLG
jgi:hypothetical protein